MTSYIKNNTASITYRKQQNETLTALANFTKYMYMNPHHILQEFGCVGRAKPSPYA